MHSWWISLKRFSFHPINKLQKLNLLLLNHKTNKHNNKFPYKYSLNSFKNLLNISHNLRKLYLIKINLLFMDYINRQLLEIVIHQNHLWWILLEKVNGMLGIPIWICPNLKLWRHIFQRLYKLTLKYKRKCKRFSNKEISYHINKINKNKKINQQFKVQLD